MRELTTTLNFIVTQDEILLALKKRGHGQGHYNGAGGKVEPNETIDEAMVRECEEEIGIRPTVYQKVAINMMEQLYKGEPCINTIHVYVVSEWEGEPNESDEMAPEWFALDKIPYDHMWPDDIHWLPKMLAGKKLQTLFRYDENDQLLSYEIKEVEILEP